jgi:hypothetical protein
MMWDRHRPEARTRRLTAVLGLAAVTLGAALVTDVSAANASGNQPTRTVHDRSIQGHTLQAEIYDVATGTHRGVPTSTVGPTVAPYYREILNGGSDECQLHEICLWNYTYFGGWGIFFYGDYAPCQGWRFEDTRFANRTYSVWNRASGPISIWDRYADGSYRYNKFGLLPSNYVHSTTPFSYIMDAWVYDPGNNCTTLTLYHI